MTTVPWLGRVEYPIISVKHAYSITLGKMLQPLQGASSDIKVPYLKSASIQWSGVHEDPDVAMWASPAERRDLTVRTGDLLVCEGGDVGRAAIYSSHANCIFQNSVHRVRATDESDIRYLYYLLCVLHGSGWLDVICNKATIRHLTSEKLGSLKIPLPSLDKQRQIADFLDAETSRIIRAAEAIRQQDCLLVERRHQVTDLSLKLTGDAPRFRLGYAASLITSGSRGWAEFTSESGEIFFRSANLHPDNIQPKLCSITYLSLPEKTKVEAGRSKIEVGDVLVGITGANAGWVALANDDVAGGYVSQHVCLTRSEARRIDSEWLAFLIASPSTQRVLMGSQYGGTKTQLSLPDIRNIRIPAVSLIRQREIAREVKRHVNLIDRQRDFRRRQIGLLLERRQALITAAVTGQFDVSTASGRGVTE